MKNCLLLLLLVMLTDEMVRAQGNENVAEEKISEKDFALPLNPTVDLNPGAVILSDIGSVSFVGNKDSRWLSYVYVRKTRIKIIDKSALSLASLHIFLYGRGERADKLENLNAASYNFENGKLRETKLATQDIFEDKISAGIIEKKFTLPDVKEGSVIEYSYSITSHRYASLPAWDFQHITYPCLYSSIEISIPDLLRYIVVNKGIDSVPPFTSSDTRQKFTMADVAVTSDVHKHKWVMKNIQGFKESTFIHSQYDYIDRIEFYLAQTYNGSEVSSRNTWATINSTLQATSDFGKAISVEYAGNLLNTMEKITALDNNVMDAAKSIYAYVRDNFSCIKDDDIFLNRDLYDVNKSRKGSVAEINLLLVALLKQRGLKADPVILSTRDYGSHPADYPLLEKMNYVICMLKMAGDTIYLDATKPQLAFGKLPLDCYNGHGRVVTDQDSGYSVFFIPESVKELKQATVFIQNDESKPGMTGNIKLVPGYHEAFNIREEVSEKGRDNYLRKLQNLLGTEISIQNAGIDSLKKQEDPLSVHCDFSFTFNGDESIVYYNPVLLRYKENPFIAAERKYPVEIPAPIDELYVFSMEIPKGYVVEEMPKSAKVSFNGNEGFYEYAIQKDEESIQLRSRIKLTRATYRADEYNTLRDFYAYVAKKQAEQIVFRKKK